MNNKTAVLAACLLFSLVKSPALRAQTKLSLAFPPELEADLSAGATAIYHLQFEEAKSRLDSAIGLRPDHPSAYFFMTMAKWYELTYDSLLQRDDKLESQFQNLADKTISAAKKFSKNPDAESVANLYWGGALGAKGWHHVARRQWVKAYFSGKKGYALLERTAQADPELYDVYLGLGMYQYYAATLGPVLKVLSSFLVQGDREKGLSDLHLAEAKSRYVRLEAAYFLWNAAMDEGRLAEAEEKSEFLNASVPDSPLFKWCEIQTLIYQKSWEDALRRCEEYAYRAHAAPMPEGHENGFKLLLAKVYFHAGLALMNMRRHGEARDYFDRCIAQPSAFAGWRTMAYLHRGMIWDLEGNRALAEKDYRKAAEGRDVWGSRDRAKDLLKNSYRNGGEGTNGSVYLSPLQQWRKEVDG